ncbi:hypothetical protein CDAR_45031 [Caerostris darwini]|uniref:Uncharacterized protein n=1 Tax=Caerostris darwini TaxID=1538125 RepID=A0AAV4UY87_9ARAC|nr:hypothetical protein CDAR_45031 [Caerostris darwini]
MRGKKEIRAYLGRSGSFGDKEEPADRENGNYGEEGKAFVLPTEKHHGRYCRGWGMGVVDKKKGGRFLWCLCDIFHDKPVAAWIFLWGCE